MFICYVTIIWDYMGLYGIIWAFFPGASAGEESTCNAGDPGLTPRSERSPEEGNVNPFQYSCLENSQGQRSLVGCSPEGRKESDTTEQLTLSLSIGLLF